MPTSDATTPLLGRPKPAINNNEGQQQPYRKMSDQLVFVIWLLLALVSHVGWGMYAVLVRYLQQFAKPPLPTWRLLTFMTSTSLVLLGIYHVTAVLAHKCMKGHKKGPIHTPAYDVWASSYTNLSTMDEGGEVEDEGSMDANTAPLLNKRVVSAPVHPTPTPTVPMPPSKAPQLRHHLLLALFLLLAAVGNAVTNVAAARFTSAAWVNLVFMWTTVIVALINYLGFGTPLPEKMWPAASAMLIGSFLVIFAHDPTQLVQFHLTPSDVIGLLLAFTSTIAISFYLVLQQHTKNFLTQEQVLWISYFGILSFSLPMTILTEEGSLVDYFKLDLEGWVILLCASVLVYFGGLMLLLASIRQIGASVVAMFIPLRLVTSFIGGILMYREVSTWLEGVGVLIVVITLSCYFYLQYKRSATEKEREQADGMRHVQSSVTV